MNEKLGEILHDWSESDWRAVDYNKIAGTQRFQDRLREVGLAIVPLSPTPNAEAAIDHLLQKARYETSGSMDATVSAECIYKAMLGASNE
jgi:hypothetical protein